VVGILYRPNTHLTLTDEQQQACFLDHLGNYVDYLDSLNTPLILLGDFNLNLFSCNNLNSSASSLIDTTISYGLLNVITRASRMACHETFSLIDHIYLKNLTYLLL
jgi:exonuclease III